MVGRAIFGIGQSQPAGHRLTVLSLTRKKAGPVIFLAGGAGSAAFWGGLAGKELLNFIGGCEHPWSALRGHQRERAVVCGARVYAPRFAQFIALPGRHPAQPVNPDSFVLIHVDQCTKPDVEWYAEL